MCRRIIEFAIITFFLGCGENELFSITIEETAQATIPGSSLGDLTDIIDSLGFDGFSDMNISESEELQNQGVSAGDISSTTLEKFELTVLSPTDGDLSFLSEVAVYVETAELEPLRIAYSNSFPEGQSNVLFEVDEVDISEYIVQDSMNITTEVTGSPPSEDTSIEAHIALEIGVTSQGACNAAKSATSDTGT